MNNNFKHYSVMLNECINALNIKPNGLYVDCTAGGGGHSLEIVKRLSPEGRLIAIDRDPSAISAVAKRLYEFSDKVELVNDNFSNLPNILNGRKPDGVLIDLGVSSYQIDTAERGFSYINDAPLDMRMNPSDSLSAYDIVNNYSEKQLADIIFNYGEEKFSKKIASLIVTKRQIKPICTTVELANAVAEAIPAKFREKGGNPAKRTFQAIRIEVNNELNIIAPTVNTIAKSLNSGGRMAIITFHSLEDRIVKQTMNELAKGCCCPSEFPVCVCEKKPTVNLISKKPVLPSYNELAENKRSHSAKLRVAEKI